ncbi:MAG: 7TM domain-containing protein [Candidatus Moranbacteria bacterium]|nr:7TM domain-containing protein [Candidatus Moranbacteria bacterium]MDD3964607.1 7TM domain-containing protein [Candidatus Moranbacteria bacterium]
MHYHSLVQFCVEQGVPLQTVLLLLMLPLVATLVAFFRQVIGIKAFGIYTPSIITFALIAFDPNGVKYGIAIFVSVILVGMVTRFILKRFRLLYLPRVAITLSIVSLAILMVLVIGGMYHRTGLASVSIFPLLIMITLAEKFIATQIEKGSKIAFILATETLVISVIGYFLISWETLANLLLAYPWVVLFTFVINFSLGKWTGLRITEYLRFRKIARYL